MVDSGKRMADLRLLVVVCSLAASAVAAAQQATGPRHANVKFGDGEACLECHKKVANHQVVHVPVAMAACGECHAAPVGKGATIGLKAGATRENTAPLCVTCHDAVGAAVKLAGAHPPAASGDCTACHDPHGAASAALLSSSPANVCLSCHDTVATAIKRASPHAPAVANCTVCHDAHGTSHALQLRAAVNPLCQSCHTGQPPAEGARTATVFGRDLPETEIGLLRRAGRISLDPLGRRGHPTASHPVAGDSVPEVAGREPLTCVSCHQPHGAVTRQLFQYGARGASDLCIHCHK